MVCKNCGQTLTPGATFCTNCGAPVENQPPAYNPTPTYNAAPDYNTTPVYNTQPAEDPGKGMAIASLILGLVSFLCLPIVTGVLGIVFGGVAKSKGSTNGMATAGIICGIVGIALWILMLVACPEAMLFAAY